MTDVNKLKQRYEVISKEIQRRELHNEMRAKEIAKAEEEIKALGFDPARVDEQIKALEEKITAKLTSLEQELDLVEKDLGL